MGGGCSSRCDGEGGVAIGVMKEGVGVDGGSVVAIGVMEEMGGGGG